MTKAAQEVLNEFEKLSPAEQQEVAIEVLRRSTASDSLSETALNELADELFREYDSEEGASACLLAGVKSGRRIWVWQLKSGLVWS